MPRYREPYTIFPRRLRSGITVYYYRVYNPDGSRSVARSTGKTNKTQAHIYCADLLAKGMLYSDKGMTFGVYAKNFFDPSSQWMADKIQTGKGKKQPISVRTVKVYRQILERYLLPYFSKIKLFDINSSHIKEFREYLIKKDLSNSSINCACVCLKIILSYAKAENLITIDPFTSIQSMYMSARTKTAFSLDELKIMFHNDWRTENRKLFALVAACTGMRFSEVSAIRKETLFPEYINVKDQFIDNDYFPVKDGEMRKVRICKTLFTLLEKAVSDNNGKAFPDSQNSYRGAFNESCGYSVKERMSKGLSFHSMRHFFNTYLLTSGISELKVKSILGHSSGKGSMTERYTNFLPEHFDDVAELQEKLLLDLL